MARKNSNTQLKYKITLKLEKNKLIKRLSKPEKMNEVVNR